MGLEYNKFFFREKHLNKDQKIYLRIKIERFIQKFLPHTHTNAHRIYHELNPEPDTPDAHLHQPYPANANAVLCTTKTMQSELPGPFYIITWLSLVHRPTNKSPASASSFESFPFRHSLNIDGQLIEIVNEFNYLGSYMAKKFIIE